MNIPLILVNKNNNKTSLNLHYNGNSSCLFVNGVKTYQFKAKDSEIKPL